MNQDDSPYFLKASPKFVLMFTLVTELQEMSAPVIEGNDAVTGHIISTTIGGKNGEPKQVSTGSLN